MGAPTLVAIRRTEGKGKDTGILCGQCFRKYRLPAKDNQELTWEGTVTVREWDRHGAWGEIVYETIYDNEIGEEGISCDTCGDTLVEGREEEEHEPRDYYS